MMDLSHAFKALKEISSLGDKKLILNDQIAQEQKRLLKLESEKSNNKEHLASLFSQLSDVKSLIHQKNQKLDSYRLDLERLINHGIEQLQVEEKNTIINNLESELFDLMLHEEKTELEQVETKQFLKGFESSFKEIFDEVTMNINQFNHEIEQLNLRIDFLLESVPTEFSHIYHKTMKKPPSKSIFTRIQNFKCEYCLYQISKQVESEIEVNLTLKCCGQCRRIFIPKSSLF